MRRPLRPLLTLVAVTSVTSLAVLAGPAPANASDDLAAATTVALATSPSAPCGTESVTDGQAHAIKHVVWVVLENKSRKRVFQDPTVDPYLTSLAQQCGQADAYQSLPYNAAKLAMTSGQDWGIFGDAATVPGPDIYSQLGTSWTQYMGDMPGNCWTTDTDTYLTRHNPAAYFVDAEAACATQDKPLPASPADVDLSQPFTWIEANVPDSMHGCPTVCSTSEDGQLAAGDAWASAWIPGLLANPQYAAGDTVIFVVWDQGGNDTTLANTAFLVLSPYTTPGYVSDVAYTHYSLLRGTEDLLGLPALAHAADPGTTSVANDFELPYPPVAGGLPVWTTNPLPPVVVPPPPT
jgi:phosphatidylinositol-3-phosphatase